MYYQRKLNNIVMKKYQIVLSSMGYDDSMFATPTPFKILYVETDSEERLQAFVESQEDLWGNKMKKLEQPFMGYEYTSKRGGANVCEYVTPTEPEFQII
jgi:hypothetical protein